MSAATSSSTAWRRASRTTFTPRSASASANREPRPSDAPATNAHGPYRCANAPGATSGTVRMDDDAGRPVGAARQLEGLGHLVQADHLADTGHRVQATGGDRLE